MKPRALVLAWASAFAMASSAFVAGCIPSWGDRENDCSSLIYYDVATLEGSLTIVWPEGDKTFSVEDEFPPSSTFATSFEIGVPASWSKGDGGFAADASARGIPSGWREGWVACLDLDDPETEGPVTAVLQRCSHPYEKLERTEDGRLLCTSAEKAPAIMETLTGTATSADGVLVIRLTSPSGASLEVTRTVQKKSRMKGGLGC